MFELVCSLYFLHSLTLYHLEIHKEKTCPHLLVSYICLTKMHTVEARSKRLGTTTHMHLFSFLCFALLPVGCWQWFVFFLCTFSMIWYVQQHDKKQNMEKKYVQWRRHKLCERNILFMLLIKILYSIGVQSSFRSISTSERLGSDHVWCSMWDCFYATAFLLFHRVHFILPSLCVFFYCQPTPLLLTFKKIW